MTSLCLRRSWILIGLLFVLAGSLLACQRPPAEPDQTTALISPPAASSETSQTDPDETGTTDPTTAPEPVTPTSSPQPDLLDLADAGWLESGHTLLLPGGKWYDASRQNQLSQIRDLVVEASGTGRPTLSLPEEAEPVLTISGSDTITFINIRFGYERSDYQVGTAVGEVPLLRISDSRNIHFINCEFFGGAAAAIHLTNVQNINFTDSQFYNNAGLPLQTDLTATPSQASFKNCSFETIDSGLMPLNLIRSSFEDCSFIGRDGYRLPVAAAACPASASLSSGLHQQLEGILAGRVSYYRDDNNNLTMRQNLFCSAEVYVLYDELLQTVKQVLPQGWYNMALAGEKEGEQEPGRRLNPYLDLQIDLRTRTNEGIYDFNMLFEDLQPLAQLPDLLQQLPGGKVRVRLFDQTIQPILSGQMAVDKLEALLQRDDAAYWLAESDWLLWHKNLTAQDFSGLPMGRITPGIAAMVLEKAWQQNNQPLLIEERSGTGQYILIQPRLDFAGTRLSGERAVHQYQLRIERRTQADRSDCLILLPVAEIEYQAGNGAKTNHLAGQAQRFTLPDNALRLLLAPLLSQPLPMTPDAQQIAASPFPELTAGESIELSLLTADDEIVWAASPVMVYQENEDQITLETVLYDHAVRPWLVRLDLSLTAAEVDGVEEARWQVDQAELITG